MHNIQPRPIPFVYIIDSPSSQDLIDGYSIGMALRDALRAIRIPCFYTLAVNKASLQSALQLKLQQYVRQMQMQPSTDAYPFIHLCMHGANEGIALTDGSYVFWQELRTLLYSHNQIKGYDPFLCMASCNGIYGSNMANAYDSVFNYLIGNADPVLQSDVTVAYLAFYNAIFFKNSSIEQAVSAMKAASFDNNFYYSIGQQIKTQRFQELVINNSGPIAPLGF